MPDETMIRQQQKAMPDETMIRQRQKAMPDETMIRQQREAVSAVRIDCSESIAQCRESSSES